MNIRASPLNSPKLQPTPPETSIIFSLAEGSFVYVFSIIVNETDLLGEVTHDIYISPHLVLQLWI